MVDTQHRRSGTLFYLSAFRRGSERSRPVRFPVDGEVIVSLTIVFLCRHCPASSGIHGLGVGGGWGRHENPSQAMACFRSIALDWMNVFSHCLFPKHCSELGERF